MKKEMRCFHIYERGCKCVEDEKNKYERGNINIYKSILLRRTHDEH